MNSHNQPPLENIVINRNGESDNTDRVKMMAVGGAVLLGIFGVGFVGAHAAEYFSSNNSQSSGEQSSESNNTTSPQELAPLGETASLAD